MSPCQNTVSLLFFALLFAELAVPRAAALRLNAVHAMYSAELGNSRLAAHRLHLPVEVWPPLGGSTTQWRTQPLAADRVMVYHLKMLGGDAFVLTQPRLPVSVDDVRRALRRDDVLGNAQVNVSIVAYRWHGLLLTADFQPCTQHNVTAAQDALQPLRDVRLRVDALTNGEHIVIRPRLGCGDAVEDFTVEDDIAASR